METKQFLDIAGVTVIVNKIKDISETVTDISNKVDGLSEIPTDLADLTTQLNEFKTGINSTIENIEGEIEEIKKNLGNGNTDPDEPDDPENPTNCTNYNFEDEFSDGSTSQGLTDPIYKQPVTFIFDKSTGNNPPLYYTNGSSVRFYTNNELTITLDPNYIFSKIEFQHSNGNGWDSGDTVSNGVINADKDFSTWEPSGDLQSVIFKRTASGHARIKEIFVYYKNKN